MLSRTQLLMILLVFVTALGVAGCANPADGTAEAEVRDADPTADAPVEPMGGAVFVISSDASTIGFVGSKVTGSHDGGFNEFGGTITVVDADPTKSRVEVEIDATSIWSDAEKLTGHLKSADFFEVETYPAARFVSTGIVATAEGFDITGDLELHGVTKSITFPATINVEEGRVAAQAEFFVKRFDFGLEYPGRADDLIRDEVVIRLDLEAVPAS